jgi:hypothetical protein
LEKKFSSLFDVSNGYLDEKGMDSLIRQYPQLSHQQCKLAFEGDVPFLYVMCLLRASAGMLKLVLAANPSGILHVDRNGCSPLHIACQRRAPLKVIQMLVDACPDMLTARNTYDAIPLFLACRQPKYLNVIEYLIQANESTVSDRTKRNETPLHSACSNPRVDAETVTYLISRNPSALETADARGRLPLHLLLLEKVTVSLELLEFVIDLYPQALSRVSDFGMTPLHLACKGRAPFEVVQLLYDRYPEALSAHFAPTPLHIAMMKRCCPTVIEFLAANYKLSEFSCVGSHYFPSPDTHPEFNAAFRRGLGRNTHILSITLVDSKIGDIGMANLLNALKTNTHLRSLTLDGANSDVELRSMNIVCQALQDFVSKNTTLTYLSLKKNCLPIKWLSLLEANTTLETLDVTDCKLGPALIPVLNSILHANSTIHTLLIGGNNVGKNGILDMFDMLRFNSSILVVDFWRDAVDNDILESAVVTLQEYNSSLTKVGLSHRYQSRQCSSSLKSSLEYFRSLNQAGRSMIRNPQTTKREFVDLLSSSAHSESLLNGLLRDLPHLWSK